jgi:hypothetical protein
VRCDLEPLSSPLSCPRATSHTLTHIHTHTHTNTDNFMLTYEYACRYHGVEPRKHGVKVRDMGSPVHTPQICAPAHCNHPCSKSSTATTRHAAGTLMQTTLAAWTRRECALPLLLWSALSTDTHARSAVMHLRWSQHCTSTRGSSSSQSQTSSWYAWSCTISQHTHTHTHTHARTFAEQRGA